MDWFTSAPPATARIPRAKAQRVATLTGIPVEKLLSPRFVLVVATPEQVA